MGDTQPSGYNPGPVLEALPGLRQRGDGLRRRGWIEIAVTYSITLVITVILYFNALYPDWTFWTPLVYCLAQALAGVLVTPLMASATRGRVRRRLATSGLFECLVLDRPLDHAPLWRALGKQIGKGKPVLGIPPLMRLSIAARRLFALLYPLNDSDSPIAHGCLGTFLVTMAAVYSSVFWSAVLADPGNVLITNVLLTIIHVVALLVVGTIAIRRFGGAWQHHYLAGYIEERHHAVLAGEALRTPADISLHLRINDLEDNFIQGNSRMLANLIGTCLLSVSAWIPGCLYLSSLLSDLLRRHEFAPYQIAAALLVVVVGLVLIPRELALRRARRDAVRLAGSYMLPQVLAGSTGEFNLQDAVPVMLRRNLNFPRMPGRYAKGLSAQLWLAGYNLDWFLNPGPRLVRPAWFAAPTLLVISLASFVVLPIIGYMGIYSGAELLLPVVAVACAGIYVHDVTLHLAWTKSLVRHLRDLAG